ncbi:hypothetical protein BC939DRAFT_468237 [Gamsiella multidivaricata]|uniref:uncharacterized protein n=1 Tax=Gamsiella multidivaricata TaxID=101098 RepID=UPI00221ED65E|nr:uncharacterized protein BC939DRAFT_468237 [Gamsiella multidivaricata]KAI7816695.1 hypothetical protein BC939DRAFT_468237 [Gamsiella multidivaricata]
MNSALICLSWIIIHSGMLLAAGEMISIFPISPIFPQLHHCGGNTNESIPSDTAFIGHYLLVLLRLLSTLDLSDAIE